jgi:hypothetical protein
MTRVYSTGSLCSIDDQCKGIIDRIFANHLGQICVEVNGQIYSDPCVYAWFREGETICCGYPEDPRFYARIFKVTNDYLVIQAWILGGWSDPYPIQFERVRHRYQEFREPVPVESSLARVNPQGRVKVCSLTDWLED